MALAEMVGNLLAGYADIGKNAHLDIAARYDKAMRVAGIVQFWERCHMKLPDRNVFERKEWLYEMIIDAQPRAPKRRRCDVHGELVFFCQNRDAADMVGVLVRYKDRLYIPHRKAEPQHTLFGFAARNARINQYSFLLVTYVIAVAIAPRI